MDVSSSPILVFVIAFLALPGIATVLTQFLTKGGERGIHPKAVVYLVSLVLTGIVLVMQGDASGIPTWTGDPILFIGAWQVWTATNAEVAKAIYRTLAPLLGLGDETPA